MFFQLNTLKGTAIILMVVNDILDLSTVNGTNLQIFIPKRYDKHPRNFYMEVPPGEDLLRFRLAKTTEGSFRFNGARAFSTLHKIGKWT